MTAKEPFRVLVADDEPMLLDSYRYVIDDLSPRRDRMTELEEQLFGPADTPPTPEVELCCVRQGEAAVAHVRDALAAGRRFGAAFLDMRMPPGISGLEAAKRIRALDSLINIVIVSGFAGVDARKITHEVPPADRLFFLAKPFRLTVEVGHQLHDVIPCTGQIVCGQCHASQAAQRIFLH